MRQSESINRRVSTRVDDDWRTVEAETLLAGTLLPLSHRAAWAQTQPEGSVSLVAVPSVGALTTSVVLQRDPSRILPGHYFLRVQRFGYGWPVESWETAIRVLSDVAKADSKVLRLNIEIFLRTDREKMRQILQANGFRQVPPRSYRHTLTLSVGHSDEELLATRKTLRKTSA